MSSRRRVPWLVGLGLALMAVPVGSVAEMSVEKRLDVGISGLLLGPGETPEPWPSRWAPLRGHVPLVQMLNVDGDTRQDGEPDLAINRVTGHAEVVWSMNVGGRYQVVHAEWTGSEWSDPSVVAASSSDELDPKFSVLANGGLALTWWRDDAVPAVFYAERPDPESAFGSPVQISGANAHASHPTVATSGGTRYVAYEDTNAGTKSVIVERKDDPTGFLPELIATTSRQECLDVQVHEAGGVVWVDWIDSDSHVGWSKRTSSGWELPRFQPYAGPEDLGRARLWIKGQAIR